MVDPGTSELAGSGCRVRGQGDNRTDQEVGSLQGGSRDQGVCR